MRKTKLPRGVFLRNGEYWIRYADQHGRIHREKSGTLLEPAKAAYRKRKTEVREGKFFPERARRRDVSFIEIARDTLEYAKAHKVHRAFQQDKWHMETLLRWFRDRMAGDITAQDIERRLAELDSEGRKPATLNRYRALLSLVFSLANRNGKVSVNPARLVRLRKENNGRVRFLSDEEEARLRGEIQAHHPEREPDFDLALHTGMRLSEQYGLRWQDVDLTLGILTIPRSKNGESRYVRINSAARSALALLWEQRDGSGLVSRPLKWNTRNWFSRATSQAQIPNFRWHDLRHTFASRLVMERVDIRTVQELMGHKTITMTVRYSHLAPGHQQEAVERLCKAKRPSEAQAGGENQPLASESTDALTGGSTSTAASTEGFVVGPGEGQEAVQVQ